MKTKEEIEMHIKELENKWYRHSETESNFEIDLAEAKQRIESKIELLKWVLL